MSIDLDQALQTYIAEARELLEEMESRCSHWRLT